MPWDELKREIKEKLESLPPDESMSLRVEIWKATMDWYFQVIG